MKRRTLVTTAALGPALAWAQGLAPGRTPLVALLAPLSADTMAGPQPSNATVLAFVRGLAALGWRAGENLRYEPRGAQGRTELYAPLLAELLALRPDVLVAAGPALPTVFAAAPALPVVMAGAEDPVGMRLAQSLARPGGNYTGVSNQSVDLMGKRIQLIHELLGRSGKVAVMWDPASLAQMQSAQQAARQRGWELLSLPVALATDLEPALRRAAAAKAVAVIAVGGLNNFEHRQAIAAAALLRLPLVYPQAGPVRAGALMSYGADIRAVYVRAAHYVDRILKGERPANMAIEQPTRFEFVLNLTTARALGLKVPQALMLRADEVVQ